MKKIFIIVAVVAVALAGCGPEKGKFVIKGEMEDMAAGELWIYNESEGTARYDTVKVEDGEFRYEGTVGDEVVAYYLVYPNATEHVIFAESGKTLTYSVTAHDLKNYSVEGNDANELMNLFRTQTSDITTENDMLRECENFIRKYPDSPAAIYLYDRYFIQNTAVSQQKLQQLLKVLATVQPKNDLVRLMTGKLNNTAKRKVGKMLPDIILKDAKDRDVALRTARDSMTMVWFWATWMRNEYTEAEKVRAFREKYAAKNRIRMITITLDGSKNQWQDFIREDSTGFIHCYDGMSWESPAVKRLGVMSVPYYILADKENKITAESDNLDALQDGLEPTTP